MPVSVVGLGSDSRLDEHDQRGAVAARTQALHEIRTTLTNDREQ
jgi:hypothetical protein